MFSTFANSVIVSKYISAQKQLLRFCLYCSATEKTNKGKPWICMPSHFLTWLNWIIAQSFWSKVISNYLWHCYNTHCGCNREPVKLLDTSFLCDSALGLWQLHNNLITPKLLLFYSYCLSFTLQALVIMPFSTIDMPVPWPGWPGFAVKNCFLCQFTVVAVFYSDSFD